MEVSMGLKKFVSVLLLALFSFSFCAGGVQAADLVKVPTAWTDREEAFFIWFAKEKGWDKEEGLNIDIQYYASGLDMLECLPSGTWVFAGMAGVPAMRGNLRYGTRIIGIANDEARSSAVLVRPDSPIAKVKGWNKDYPDVYGSPDTVKGKTFLTTHNSSAHYALTTWLKIFGLTDEDVTIMDMDQTMALANFDNKTGDGVTLWAPYMYTGLEEGWKVASDLQRCNVVYPVWLVADNKYAEAHPDVTAKFLKIYLRAIKTVQSTAIEKVVPEYQRFFLEWAGKKYSKELCLRDLQMHPVFDIDQQLALFDESSGVSKVDKWQEGILEFLNRPGAKHKEMAGADIDAYATDKFLRMVKEQQKAGE